MARGFDSKQTEWQQQQAEEARAARERPRQELLPEQRALLDKRHRLELALARTRADLANATQDRHRELLRRSLAALEQQLAALLAGA